MDANVSSLNNLLLIVERYTAKAAPILDDLSSAAGAAADAAAQVRGLFAALDDTQELNEQLLTALQSVCTELSAACGSLSAGLDALEQAFALMVDGPAAPDTAQQGADIGALQAVVSTLETTVTRVLEEHGAVGARPLRGGLHGLLAARLPVRRGQQHAERLAQRRELTALNSEISDASTFSGCGGWGSVTSESGDYVGGVAGLSLSSIRVSYAKCALSGGKYAGGIAGSGSRVRDCISMVEITDCTQLAGAVAGEVTGEYCGNRFVSDTLTAIAAVITLVIRKRRAKAAKRAQ